MAAERPKPKQPDSTADVEAAAAAVSPELARELRDRQQAVADTRRRAVTNSKLLSRRVG